MKFFARSVFLEIITEELTRVEGLSAKNERAREKKACINISEKGFIQSTKGKNEET